MSTGLTPETREEQFMAAAAGDSSAASLPKPVTRKEIYLKAIADNAGGGGGGGGTTDYTQLSNKPQINSHELSGNKTSSDLGLQDSLTEAQLAAVNSGITAEKLTEDESNISSLETNISLKADATDLAALEAEVDTKADASDLTTATNSLQAQINNIVSGSTADSEVINARVGADGTTYQTLKARIDAEVTNLQTQIDTLETVAPTICTEYSTYDSTYDSFYATEYGLTASNMYISFGITLTADTRLYTASKNETYFSICTYNNTSFENGRRYRAFDQEDTLPYESTPLNLTKGTYVVFSVQKGDRNFSVVLEDINKVISYNGDIPLAEAHVNQVVNRLLTSKCHLRYIGSSGSDQSTERVEVYIPAGVGYVEYEFVHSVSVASNADIWRIAYAYACDSHFSHRFAITTSGEWEFAVRLPDRSDYSGGITHGDEVLLDDAAFFIDGALVDITDYTDLTTFENFTIVESSAVYDPDDSTTVIANHGSEHIFSHEGLKINQSLKWLAAQNVTYCYMAMHLPAKAKTDHMYMDSSIIPFEITTYNLQFPDTKKAVVYGEDSGVKTEFSIGQYPVIENGNYLLLTDNNGGAYNKCYYVITTSSSVTANTVWKTETNYKFEVNK